MMIRAFLSFAALLLSCTVVGGMAAVVDEDPASGRVGSFERSWNYTREGSEATFWKLAWSPDGEMIACTFFDSSCVVLDASDGTEVASIDLLPAPTRCDGFSPEGTLPTRSVAFSPDGSLLAIGGDDMLVHIISTEDWSETGTLRGHAGSVLCLDFSPDGKHLASGSGTDKVVPNNAGENVTRIWDTENWTQVLELRGHRDGVLAVEWSNAGDRIATASDDRTIKVWGFPEGDMLVNVSGHTSGVLDIDWSPDDSTLVTGSRDYKVKVWNSTTGETLSTWPDYNCVRSVDYHPDATLVATSGVDLTLKLRDSGTGTSLKVVKDGVDQHAMVMCSKWSPDGTRLASGLGKSHSLIVYSFGIGGGDGGNKIPMMPVTIASIAIIFVIFLVILYIPAVRQIRRTRP